MDLTVDLSNPAEVATKMPQLLRLYEEKLHEQKTLNDQVELLRRLVGHAWISRGRTQANQQGDDRPNDQARRRRAAPAQDRAVQALKQAADALAGTAVGPTSLYKFMVEKGMEVPKDPSVLGTNLWDAWKAGRIMRAPNGVYTPLDGTGNTEWDRALTDYYFAAERGLPVPGSWRPDGGHR
jgi:hypothetical protein